ncbi:MAG: response regulator [Ignavibacteria bacterium]|nr:response regulator [Ignavibacteria bacterium]MBI3766635.1 response regulator [Ignavibacteriales bacterium]
MLQKVFAIHPEHGVALSYQDRIQFLVKQLSQRVGLSRDIQTEIRKYKDIYLQRKNTQISSILVAAQKMLEDGHFKKASEQANRVLSLDSQNMYAKALLQRLTDLQHRAGTADIDSEQEFKFSSVLKESWRNGKPSEAQLSVLTKIQGALKVQDARRLALEREVKNSLYKEALYEIWNTGGLSAFTAEAIDHLRAKYKISRMDHSFIEMSLLREVRKNKIRGTILLVEEDENALLEMAAKFRSHFYAVIAAQSFDEALSILKTVTTDVVISEVMLDGMTAGFDLYEFVRTTPATTHIPFIFMTSSLDRTTQLIGKRLGVDEFITKPIDYELLFATIDGKLLPQTEHTKSLRKR